MIADKIINVLLKYPNYKLIGGQSIRINSIDKPYEARETIDVDIRSLEDGVDELVKILNEHNLKTVVRTTKAGNYKLIVIDGPESIKLDIEHKEIDDIKSNIKSFDESIRDKMFLAMKYQDRMFKNVVDVVICLYNQYPQGISKKDILSLIDETCLAKLNLDVLIDLSIKFRPQILNDLTMEEYAVIFYNLVEGLLDDRVPRECIFKHNSWQY